MTGRKRWRPPWPVLLVGTFLVALPALGFGVYGIGRLLLAAVGAR